MRATLALVLMVLCATLTAMAEPAAIPLGTHIRPLSRPAAELLQRAADRSATVRTQLQELEQTDVVVYLVDSMQTSTVDIRSGLHFLSVAAGTRYLVVWFDRWNLPPWEAVAMFGHELHHALEIAAVPDVQGAAQVASLYKAIGWEWGTGRYESDGARKTADRIRYELTGSLR